MLNDRHSHKGHTITENPIRPSETCSSGSQRGQIGYENGFKNVTISDVVDVVENENGDENGMNPNEHEPNANEQPPQQQT